MWEKISKFISENFRIIATLVIFSIATFINEGLGGSFSMQKFTENGFVGFSVKEAIKGTLMAYVYLFEGLSILGVLILIMWRIIAGYWLWDAKEHTKNARKMSNEEFEEAKQEVGGYVSKLVIFATLGVAVAVAIIVLIFKLYIYYKTGSWWLSS